MKNTYNVCSVTRNGENSIWTTVGVAFPNKNGSGFSIILNALPPARYGQIKLVVLPRKQREAQSEEAHLPVEE